MNFTAKELRDLAELTDTVATQYDSEKNLNITEVILSDASGEPVGKIYDQGDGDYAFTSFVSGRPREES